MLNNNKKQETQFFGTKCGNANSIAAGYATETTNYGEIATGILNKSTKGDDPNSPEGVVGDPKATLFSVGCGTKGERKNALEVKGDGSVIISGKDGSDVNVLDSVQKAVTYEGEDNILIPKYTNNELGYNSHYGFKIKNRATSTSYVDVGNGSFYGALSASRQNLYVENALKSNFSIKYYPTLQALKNQAYTTGTTGTECYSIIGLVKNSNDTVNNKSNITHWIGDGRYETSIQPDSIVIENLISRNTSIQITDSGIQAIRYSDMLFHIGLDDEDDYILRLGSASVTDNDLNKLTLQLDNIQDATSVEDVITKFNTLIANLKALGFMAPDETK